MALSKNVKIQTLGELGPTLPIGFAGSAERGLLHKRWRLKEEKEISSLFDEESKFDRYISGVLATMFTKIGPHNFEELDKIKRQIVISQMAMQDVYYAYLYLRVQAIGNELTFKVACPKCREKFSWTVDLKTIEVKSIDNIEDGFWVYKLKDPFSIRGKLVTEFKLGPAKWMTMQAWAAEGMNLGSLKAGIINGSIVSVGFESGHSEIPLAKTELDEMSKIDFETLASEINENVVGPDMSVECQCPKCSKEFKTSIEWASGNFFVPSSQSGD